MDCAFELRNNAFVSIKRPENDCIDAVNLLPGSFAQHILIAHSKSEDAQTCALRDAENKAVFQGEINIHIKR